MNAPQQAKLLSIGHEGLKAQDKTYDLTAPVVLLLGQNGSGKTTVVDAISLLVNGWVLGVDKTNDGIMTLARGDRLRVFGTVRLPDGRTGRMSRTWTRTSKRKNGVDVVVVNGDIECSWFHGSDSEKDGIIKGIFGAIPEAWNPGEVLDLTPAKMRDRLLRLIPATEIGDESLVPKDCPAWARDEFNAMQPHEWVQQAIRRTKDKISKTQASNRETNVELDNVGDAHAGLKDLEPMRSMLVMLRRELATVGQKKTAEANLVRAQKQLDLAREKAADALHPAIVYLVAGVLDAAMIAIDQEAANDLHARGLLNGKIAEQERALQLELGARSGLRTRLERYGDIPEATDENLAGLTHQLTELEADEARLQGAIAAIEAEIKRHKDPVLHACPACSFDLRAFNASEQEARAKDLDTQHADLALLELAIEEVDGTIDRTRRGIAMAADAKDLAAVEARIISISDEADRLTKAKPDPRQYPDTSELRVEVEALVEDALERALSFAAIESLETKVADLFRDLETLPETRSTEEIENESKQVDQQIEEAVRWNERVARFRDAEEQRLMIEEQLGDLDKWLKKFTKIQAQLVAKTKAWYETRLSAVCGATVTVELVNARGSDDCRFAVDGVYAETLNVGHRQTFVVALFVVLAGASSAPWRPILVDQFEHISIEYRSAFLLALMSAVESGAVSQCVVAGCPDQIPEIEGAKVYRLSRGGDVEEDEAPVVRDHHDAIEHREATR